MEAHTAELHRHFGDGTTSTTAVKNYGREEREGSCGAPALTMRSLRREARVEQNSFCRSGLGSFRVASHVQHRGQRDVQLRLGWIQLDGLCVRTP